MLLIIKNTSYRKVKRLFLSMIYFVILLQKISFFFLKILLIIIMIYSIHYQKGTFIDKTKNLKINNKKKPIINNYRLYNTSDNPFLSIILDFPCLNQINDTFSNFIQILTHQIREDIQIIFLYNSSTCILWKKSIQTFFRKKNIQCFYFDIKDWTENFFGLLNLVKGKFVILINKIIKIEKNYFSKAYNITIGNIENIFTLKIKNETFNLIRTKVLRDIEDTGKQFHNFTEIVNYINTLSSPRINVIPIAFCLDDFYTYLTYTSMISILNTKDYYTYISFFLVVSSYFSEKNIRFIESLYEQFEFFNITFIRMDNRYEKAFINRYISYNSYFRLSLGELLPNLNKIIYLDSDIICLKDLSNLYNLNFKGKIFIGRIINFNNRNNSFKINAGVLLLNLFLMRKMKIEKNVLTLLKNGFHDSFHDQAIINNFYKKYIGFLPPEFNSIKFNYEKVKKRYKRFGGLYDFDSLYFSFKFPYVIHFHGNPKTKTYNEEDWYYFARRSKYFRRRTHNYSNIFKYINKI